MYVRQIGNVPAMGLKQKVWVIGLVGLVLLVGCTTRYQELMDEGEEHYSQQRYDDAIFSYTAAFQVSSDMGQVYSDIGEIIESLSQLSGAYRAARRTREALLAAIRMKQILNYCNQAGYVSGLNCRIPEELRRWP